jgi:hypothetical protein
MTFRAMGSFVGWSVFALSLLGWESVARAQNGGLQPLPPPQNTAPAPPATSSPPPAAPAEAAPPAPPPPAEPSERLAPNAAYVEALGASLFYSLNIDHAWGDVSGRVGIGAFSTGGTTWIGVPITISYLGIGSKKHMFEIGGGVSIQYFNTTTSQLIVSSTGAAVVLGTVIVGYRLQPPKGGFVLRAGFSPLFGAGGFIPWPHFAIGAAF